MQKLIDQIVQAKRIILSTHRQCDGDGLGAQLALFFALNKLQKEVRIINVDATPKKYRYLEPEKYIQYFDHDTRLPEAADLLMIFDTNDARMLEPLFTPLAKVCKTIAFIDHHPVLTQGPIPSKDSIIDTSVASTGELAFRMIKALGVGLDKQIANCLYTSVVFDTQNFRFIRNSPNSHLIAAELLSLGVDAQEVHRYIFGNQTVQKMAFLAKMLGQIEYHCNGSLAILKLRDQDLFHYNLEPDDSRDVIDMVMNIESLEAATLFREDGNDEYKVSFRSKGGIQILPIAESFGGGGHLYAAGAFVKGNYDDLKKSVVEKMQKLIGANKKTAS